MILLVPKVPLGMRSAKPCFVCRRQWEAELLELGNQAVRLDKYSADRVIPSIGRQNGVFGYVIISHLGILPGTDVPSLAWILASQPKLRNACPGSELGNQRRPGRPHFGTYPNPRMLNPVSTYTISPVMPLARSEHRKAAALPTSCVVTVRRSGVCFST